jgi:enamine deaminase RidA (YjgF/YER057c/UK114 family)
VTPEERLAELGLPLPPPPPAVAAYLPWQRAGDLLTTSFQLPWLGGELAFVGRLGRELTTEQGYEAARLCALNAVAQLADAAGDLRRIRVFRLEGHVGCTEDFEEIPQVLNGASELVNAVFGERGRHARTALGHMVMPLRAAVMVGLWAELDGG